MNMNAEDFTAHTALPLYFVALEGHNPERFRVLYGDRGLMDLTADAASEELARGAARMTDPDGPKVRIRTAYRDLSCSGSGEETHRRFILPGSLSVIPGGSGPKFATRSGPEIWGSQRLPASGSSAHQRRASVAEEFPIGTVVIDYESRVFKFSKSQAKCRAGRLVRGVDGKGTIVWFEAPKILRSRPVYQFTLEDGSILEVQKRTLL